MYGGNDLKTHLKDGSTIAIKQETNYPWDGAVNITFENATSNPFAMHLRIPGWCKKASLKVNGKLLNAALTGGQYKEVKRAWKKGDKIELVMDMPATLIESNPLVEETKNQVAIKRGPIVYCLESSDLPNEDVFDVAIPANIKLQPSPMKIGNGNVMVLTGEARVLQNNDWKNTLYKEVNTNVKPVKIKLIPYYAWANRGKTDMTVWLPLMR
jgi:DUF1680 family protein